MSFIKYIETIKDIIYDVQIKYGQVVHATDTNETFFDTKELNRVILDNVIYLNKVEELNLLARPLTNRVYIVKENSTAYRYDGTWYKIKDGDSLLCTLFHNDEYVPTTIMKKGTKIAPRTLASVVYNDLGESIVSELEDLNKLTLCKTKSVYVEATQQQQKVFRIPYPISNYDFRKNFMSVIIDGYIIEESRFTIRDDNYLVLNDNEKGLDSGQLILFIFYYNVYIDINDKLLLQPSNIQENTNKRFVSDAQINYWNRSIQDLISYKESIEQEISNNKKGPNLLVSATEPSSYKDTDIWVDTTNFIFKVRKDNSWIPMGAVYK